jgi:hypothetical protein
MQAIKAEANRGERGMRAAESMTGPCASVRAGGKIRQIPRQTRQTMRSQADAFLA